jgi:hypothetical protein
MSDFNIKEMAAPINEALAKMEEALAKSKVPLAIEVGKAILAARKEVEAKGYTDAKGKVHSDWPGVFHQLCDLLNGISPRTAYDYMLLAEHPDLSQHAASIREALKLIDEYRKANNLKRKPPTKPETDTTSKAPKDEDEDEDGDEEPTDEPTEEQKQQSLLDGAQTALKQMTEETRQQLIAEIKKDEEPQPSGLQQGIEQRDADLIATSIFDTLKEDLAKAEVQRVIHRLQSLVNRHNWQEGADPPPTATSLSEARPEGSA